MKTTSVSPQGETSEAASSELDQFTRTVPNILKNRLGSRKLFRKHLPTPPRSKFLSFLLYTPLFGLCFFTILLTLRILGLDNYRSIEAATLFVALPGSIILGRSLSLWWKKRPYWFSFMRLEEDNREGDYPLLLLQCPRDPKQGGFSFTHFRPCSIDSVGDIVVSVNRGDEKGLAIIHLRSEGRLAVTSFALDRYRENVLPPLAPEIKELALEFSEKCDQYLSERPRHLQRTSLNARHLPSEALSSAELASLWKDIVLEEKLKSDLIALAQHFATGSAAASRGLLLYGPPGTGKTLIARKLAQSVGCAFYPLSVSDLKAGHVGQSAGKVKEIWARALEAPRAVLFVDECEGVFGRRGGENSDSFVDEIVQTFLAQWDGFAKQTTVWVVGATNRRDRIDSAILSRFGEEIQIPLPGPEQRRAILAQELQKKGVAAELPSETERATQGFSGRDLESLAGRLARKTAAGEPITVELLTELSAKKRKGGSTPSASNATWDKLILPADTLTLLQNTTGLLQNAEAFAQRGISIPRGILLTGPPGTGKTQIARTMAQESGLQFIAAGTADLKAGYLGQSGRRVQALFERARAAAPSILFIDELDIIAPDRSRGGSDAMAQEIIGQLLQELDGVSSADGKVFLLAATNLPDSIDSAIRSRFPTTIEIPLPDAEGRAHLLRVFLHSKPLDFELKSHLPELASATENMSGRDLRSLVERAEQRAVGRAIQAGDPDSVCIMREDFESILTLRSN